METVFPGFIYDLPEADIPFKGVKGWVSQSGSHQVVFMEIEAIGKVKEHSHGAQWGVVLEGEMELTIGSDTRTYIKGDRYFIPAGVVHAADFKRKTYVIDYFNEPSRYRTKTNPSIYE